MECFPLTFSQANSARDMGPFKPSVLQLEEHNFLLLYSYRLSKYCSFDRGDEFAIPEFFLNEVVEC